MKHMPDIGAVMTPVPHYVASAADLSDAVRLMYAAGIRHLPVVDAGQIVGVLSDRDAKLARAVSNDCLEGAELAVSDVCITEPYVVSPDERLDVVLDSMVKAHIGSALVAKNGKLIGIFTASDACRQLSELLKIHYPDA